MVTFAQRSDGGVAKVNLMSRKKDRLSTPTVVLESAGTGADNSNRTRRWRSCLR